MDAGSAVSVIATVLLAAGGSVMAYGKGIGAAKEKFRLMEDTFARYDKYHADHYKHAQDDEDHFRDTEIHWTPRERDDLNNRMKEIKEGQDRMMRLLLERPPRKDHG